MNDPAPLHEQPVHRLSLRQRLFVGLLLLLGVVHSWLIVRYVDPTTAQSSRVFNQSLEVRG
jgi:hypothetical protein